MASSGAPGRSNGPAGGGGGKGPLSGGLNQGGAVRFRALAVRIKRFLGSPDFPPRRPAAGSPRVALRPPGSRPKLPNTQTPTPLFESASGTSGTGKLFRPFPPPTARIRHVPRHLREHPRRFSRQSSRSRSARDPEPEQHHRREQSRRLDPAPRHPADRVDRPAAVGAPPVGRAGRERERQRRPRSRPQPCLRRHRPCPMSLACPRHR